jgi:hypothetical protein
VPPWSGHRAHLVAVPAVQVLVPGAGGHEGGWADQVLARGQNRGPGRGRGMVGEVEPEQEPFDAQGSVVADERPEELGLHGADHGDERRHRRRPRCRHGGRPVCGCHE